MADAPWHRTVEDARSGGAASPVGASTQAAVSPGAHIEVVGLTGAAHYNGREGCGEGSDVTTGRSAVRQLCELAAADSGSGAGAAPVA